MTKWYQSWLGAILLFATLLILGLVAGGVALQYALEPAKPSFPAR